MLKYWVSINQVEKSLFWKATYSFPYNLHCTPSPSIRTLHISSRFSVFPSYSPSFYHLLIHNNILNLGKEVYKEKPSYQIFSDQCETLRQTSSSPSCLPASILVITIHPAIPKTIQKYSSFAYSIQVFSRRENSIILSCLSLSPCSTAQTSTPPNEPNIISMYLRNSANPYDMHVKWLEKLGIILINKSVVSKICTRSFHNTHTYNKHCALGIFHFHTRFT